MQASTPPVYFAGASSKRDVPISASTVSHATVCIAVGLRVGDDAHIGRVHAGAGEGQDQRDVEALRKGEDGLAGAAIEQTDFGDARECCFAPPWKTADASHPPSEASRRCDR